MTEGKQMTGGKTDDRGKNGTISRKMVTIKSVIVMTGFLDIRIRYLSELRQRPDPFFHRHD